LATDPLHYTAQARSDVGKKRPGNEDSFGYDVEHGVYLVCDGLGGAAAGEVASSMAVETVLRLLNGRTVDESAPLHTWIEESVRTANSEIYSRAKRERQLSGMGTTLVGMVAEGSRVLVFNVGDSRCYRMSAPQDDAGLESRLQQISIDHSLVQEQVSLGHMTRAEAARSPYRSVITRALGTQSEVETDLFEIDVRAGDLFLFCSDGLTSEVSDAQIESLLAAELSLEELCASLVAAANEAGGRDNITCLLVRAEALAS